MGNNIFVPYPHSPLPLLELIHANLFNYDAG
jgi:hypothetical protein